MNYAALDPKTGQIARLFPYDQLGLEMAYSLARRHGYEVWETIDGKPRYLIGTVREPEVKPGRTGKGPKLIADMFKRR